MRECILIVSLLFVAFPAAAEKIILRSGGTIDAPIVDRTEKSIKVDINKTAVTYYFDEIDTIDGEKPSLPNVLPAAKKEDRDTVMAPVAVKPEVLPSDQVPADVALIDQVLELNGTKDWLDRLPARNERMIDEVPRSVKGDVEGFRKLREDLYGTKSINKYFYGFLRKYYDETRFRAFRDFLITPLGKKIAGREKADEQMSEQARKAENEAFAKDVPTEKRYALISGLIHSTKIFRLELVAVGYARGLLFKTKFHMTDAQLQDEIAHLIDEQGGGAKGAIEGIFPEQGFLCRHFSDQELEEYIRFVSSPDIEYVQEAIYQAVVETFAEMRKDYVAGFKERFPESVEDSTGADDGGSQGTPSLETMTQKRERASALMEQAEELQRRGDEKQAQQVSDKSFSLMEQVLFLDPEDISLCVSLGISYQMQHYRLGRAAVLLEKAIASGAQIPQVQYTLGLIYLEWGKLDRAEEFFNETLALSADPVGKVQAYNGLGSVYRDKGQLDRAVDALEQAIAVDAKDPGSYGLLALIAAQQNKIETAEKYLRQAEQLGLDPAHTDQVKAMIRKNKKSAWPF